MGSGAVVLTAQARLTLGQLHRILATIDGRNASLTLDSGASVYGSSRGSLTSLNVGSTIHIGSLPALTVSPMYAVVLVNVHVTVQPFSNRSQYAACPSVRPFVCLVRAHDSKTKKRGKSKIDVNVSQVRSNPVRQFSAQRSGGHPHNMSALGRHIV